MQTDLNAIALGSVNALRRSDRMPVLFLGHGSPTNALPGNDYFNSWRALGTSFGTTHPVPQLILCISAHWLTRGWHLTAMVKPKTIHDFRGFAQDLFDQQYPVPGDAAAARAISTAVRQRSAQPLGLDTDQWGLDHGAWGVLKPMFPAADIPVIQLSMDYSRPPSEHYELAKQLKALRSRGVLIVGSGNVVHNLQLMQRGAAAGQAYDWALEFDQTTGGHIQQGNLAALQNFLKLGSLSSMAHPSHEHYLPLLYAAGAVDSHEPVRVFNVNYQGGSVAMRSMVWG